MAVGNAVYPLWKQALMQELPIDKSLDQGSINPLKGCYLSLVDINTYVYSEAHQFYSEITGQQAPAALITNGTVNGNIFDGDDVVFTNVIGTGGNPQVGAVVIARQNAGVDATWRLVLYEDTGITGVPLIPSGGNILVQWNVQGIFGL